MASIDLHLHEVEAGWMPPACARCGDDADCTRSKTVVWSPWWMPLLIMATGFLILVPFVRVLFFGLLDTGRRVTIHLPFCDRHRNHWRWRSWPLLGLLLIALCLIGGGITVASMPRQLDPANEVEFLSLGVAGLGMIVAA